MTDQEKAAGAANEQEQSFAIQKIYIKDLSFETPNTPKVFTDEWKPEVNVELGTEGKRLSGDVFEIVLSITVTVTLEEKTAYLVEVQQAGIFNITGLNDTDLSTMIGAYCPNILFPFARELISDLVTKGGFPQFLIAPVNFDALYAEHMDEESADPTA